jgi:hypothetical protein
LFIVGCIEDDGALALGAGSLKSQPFFVIIEGQMTERERFFQVSGIITDGESKPVSNVGVILLN